MKINLTPFKGLNDHLTCKLANHDWFTQCLEGNPAAFPYQIKRSGKASFDRFIYIPTAESNKTPIGDVEGKPSYLVNIPMIAHQLKKTPLQKFLKIFQDEAFGIDANESLTAVKQRLAVVIGINQPYSIDNAVNEDFTDCIADLPKVKKIACRTFGFFWYPLWETTSSVKRLYPKETGYLLLKAFDKEKAADVRTLKERKLRLPDEKKTPLESQIPFQRIRERIKDSSQSQLFASHFERCSPRSPMYLGVMDSDCLALRSTTGLFSLLDKEIVAQEIPSAIACRYQAQKDELPIIRLGIKLDMTVRSAMNSIVPYSAYLPEPSSFFCIRVSPGSNILGSLSFIGEGRSLETRRLIQNARLQRLFNDRVTFLKDGDVTIETPDRMKTKKNKLITVLTPQILKQKSKLQALRNVSQTHATPKKWADSIYIALGFSYSIVTDVTTPMMNIFQVFDPITRMFSLVGRYSNKNFDQVMRDYHKPLSESNQNLLKTARAKLYNLDMPVTKIDLVESAAKASGEAIYQFLLQETTIIN